MARAPRFERISKLGEGGMGIVYEAHDRERNMRVALKTLRCVNATNLYRFKREFRALSDLSHPNIIALYELVAEGDEWYLSMELIEGDELISYVHRPNVARIVASSSPVATPDDITVDTRVIAPPSDNVTAGKHGAQYLPKVPDEPVPVQEIVDLDRLMDVLPQLAQALYALHSQGIIHRDLKPSNVRVSRDGRVVLMDFGIVAETMSETAADRNAPALGTPAYMAPEQGTSAPPSAAADWYAFGVLIYQALTGRLPFRGPRGQMLQAKQNFDPIAPSAYVTGIPEELEELCVQLLARNSIDRPQGYGVLTTLGVAAESISSLMSEVTFIGLNEFVGRTKLLQQLERAFHQCLHDGAVLAIAEGVSGMGKTTLLRRFIYELQATQIGSNAPIFLAGRCHERESLSYKAFDGVIDQLSRELLDLPDHIVASLLPADITPLARIFPVLKRVPGVHTTRMPVGSSLEKQRERAGNALRSLLIALGEWRPVVIRIEDLQWADSDSIELLLEVLRAPAPPRLMLVASRRTDIAPTVGRASTDDGVPAGSLLDEALATLDGQVTCHHIEVGPLSANEQTLLVAKLAGERNLPTGIDDDYWSEADGNPLLLAELARYAGEEPESVRQRRKTQLVDIIGRRIARLPDPARHLLAALSIAGEPTPLWLLAEATDLSDDERERASSTLRVAKLARIALPGHEPWLSTQHDKIRETVQSSLSADEQRDLHYRLAQSLERWDAASIPSLARHWLAAGERERAVEYLQSSAKTALDKLAFDRAAEHYQMLLDVAVERTPYRRVEYMAALGQALAQGGRHQEAAMVYSRAVEYAADTQKLEFTRLAAENLLRAGLAEQGIELLGELMKQFGIPLRRTRGGKLMKLAMQRFKLAIRGIKYTARTEDEIPARDLGRVDTLYAAATTLGMIDHLLGSVVQTQHLQLALQCGEEMRVCRALAIEVNYLGAASGKHRKRAEELIADVHRRAHEFASGQQRSLLLGLAHLGAGNIAFYNQEMASATQAYEQSLQVLDRVAGAEWERTTADYFLGMARFHRGDWQTAMAQVKLRIEYAERRGDRYALNLFKSELYPWYWLTQDRVDRAHACVDEALSGWSEESYYVLHHQASVGRAAIHLYAGDGASAATVLDAVLARLGGLMLHEAQLILAQLYSLRGRAAIATADFVEARKYLKRLRKVEVATAPGLARLLDVPLRLREGDRAAGRALLNEAIVIFSEADCAHLVAACQYRLAMLEEGELRQQLQTRAMAWMSAHEVLNPERLVTALTW